MIKNQAGQTVGAQMINASNGAAFTGAVSVDVTVDGLSQSPGAGSSPVHEGGGFHTYSPLAAETNGDHVAFTFSGSGAIPATIQVYTSLTPAATNIDIDSQVTIT